MITVKLLTSGRIATIAEDASENSESDFVVVYRDDRFPMPTRLIPTSDPSEGAEWNFGDEFAFSTGDVAGSAEREAFTRLALGFHALPVFHKEVRP